MNFKIHSIEGYIQTIYLIETKEGLLLLDGCSRPDIATVGRFIESDLNKKFSDLKLVVSTHSHPDHSGGLSYFKQKGVLIAGPQNLNQLYSGLMGWMTYLIDILLTQLVALNKKKKLKNIFFPREVELDFICKEGDKLPGFEMWSVLECPGHTEVDLSLYNKDEKIAYVADNFVGSSKKVYPPYPMMKPDLYKSSLQKYLDLGIEDFLIAHYGRVKVSEERIKELLNSTLETPRIHRNSLHAIFLKLFRSLIKK